MSYEGNDPLDLWNRYIQWVEENYPQGGKEGDLLTILEKCLEKLKDAPQYQSDQRLLDIYLRYLDLTDNSVEWFQMLYAGGYFHQLANFYINWAEKVEVGLNYKEATRVYQLGLQNHSEPANKLDECFKKYQVPLFFSIFHTFKLEIWLKFYHLKERIDYILIQLFQLYLSITKTMNCIHLST